MGSATATIVLGVIGGIALALVIILAIAFLAVRFYIRKKAAEKLGPEYTVLHDSETLVSFIFHSMFLIFIL